MKRAALCAILSFSLSAGIAGAAEVESAIAPDKVLPAEAREYLLDGPIIYKVNSRSSNLIGEDLNGDGLVDLAVVTNEKSVLEVFYQRGDVEQGEDRFEKETITLDRIIRNLVPYDVNGDGRIDLVVAAAPESLGVIYQDGNGRLTDFEELDLAAHRLVVGDLTGDGRDDVLVYASRRFDILPGKKRGLDLEPAETFFTSSEPASSPMILDFDGDGRMDIVYHDSERFEDLVTRLQSAEKTFPMEFRASTSMLRTVSGRHTPKGRRDEIAGVHNLTRSLVRVRLADSNKKDAADKSLGLSLMQVVAFDPEMRSGKTFPFVADVDGDGRGDVVIYSPDVSALRVLKQTRAGLLDEIRVPSFQGIESITALNVPKDAPTPMILYSPSEQAIGYLRYDRKSETLPFPRILPVKGQPLGVTVVTIKKQQVLAVMVEPEKSEIPMLMGYTLSEDGELGEEQRLYAAKELDDSFVLSGVDVVGIKPVDLNRDGRDDLIVFADFSPAVILLQNENGKFEELQATSAVLKGLLSGAKPSNIIAVNLGTKKKPMPSVLAIKDNFARTFSIDDNGNVVVEQQFNGRNANARVASAAVGNVGSAGEQSVVLLDRGNNVLTVYTKVEKGTEYEIAGNIKIGKNDYSTLTLFDLDGDGKDDVFLTAEDKVGLMYSHPFRGELEILASASPMDDEGGYGAVYTLDLIGNEEEEIAAIEMKDNLMELFAAGDNAEKVPDLLRFYQFKMFDTERAFARRVNLDALPEPREMIAVDIDDDGRVEIVALMHDNIIIYYPVEKTEETAHLTKGSEGW